MRSTQQPQRFSAEIYKLGINPCVDVPVGVSEAFGRRGAVPVVGTLNGHKIRATLVPKGGGRHRLYINGKMRRAASVDVGDTVSLALRIDTESREIPMPEDVANALRSRKGAREAFDTLPPSQRKEFLRWVLGAKKPETRERRIERGINHILQQSER